MRIDFKACGLAAWLMLAGTAALAAGGPVYLKRTPVPETRPLK